MHRKGAVEADTRLLKVLISAPENYRDYICVRGREVKQSWKLKFYYKVWGIARNILLKRKDRCNLSNEYVLIKKKCTINQIYERCLTLFLIKETYHFLNDVSINEVLGKGKEILMKDSGSKGNKRKIVGN